MPIKNPTHPGLSVLHDCIEPLGLTIAEAAKHLGVSCRYLSDLVHCRTGITPEMAIRLDKAFGGEAYAWCQIQAAYDLAQAQERIGDIKVKRLRRAKQLEAA